ncbi:LOW QUALITY PROTEIN: hypothetical protein ACHAXH_000997 [Discostella pseudostelligera]
MKLTFAPPRSLALAISRSRSRDKQPQEDEEDPALPYFLYTGQPASTIPRDIQHVIIDPSVKVISERAFYDCDQLEIVEFCHGLEEIKDRAFRHCTSLTSICIPSTVRIIDDSAFRDCTSLVEVQLCGGINNQSKDSDR